MENINIKDIEIVDGNIIRTIKIDNAELPTKIAKQFDNISILNSNVKQAVNMALDAKKKASEAQVQIGLFNKKDAIELLQSATKGLSEAQISASEAQKLSFEYQTKLTGIMESLFELGVGNLVMNRIAVQEIELKLQGASNEELSELAKGELERVLYQLKAQQDILQGQENLKEILYEHNNKLETQIEVNKMYENKILILDNYNKDIDKKFGRASNEIIELGKNLTECDKRVVKQGIKLAENSKDLTEHYEVLEHYKEKAEELENKICNNAKNIQNIETDFKQQRQEQEGKSKTLDKKISDFNQSLKKELYDLKDSAEKDSEFLRNRIYCTIENVNKQILAVNEDLLKANSEFSNEVQAIYNELTKTISELKDEVAETDKAFDDKFKKLIVKIDNLEVITSKLVWKIGISVVAVGSLILNILQICGVI